MHTCQPAPNLIWLIWHSPADYPHGDPHTPAAPALYSGPDTSGSPNSRQVVDKILRLLRHEAGEVLPPNERDFPLPCPVACGVPRNWSR